MYWKQIDHQFQPGDLVTLRAMTQVPSEGKPQILAVVFVRADWSVALDSWVDVRYYGRALCESKSWSFKEGRQSFYGGQTLTNGLVLVEEQELVRYDPEEKQSQKEEG